MSTQLVRTISRSNPLIVFPFRGVWIASVGSLVQGGVSKAGDSPADAIAKLSTHFVVIPNGPVICAPEPIDEDAI